MNAVRLLFDSFLSHAQPVAYGCCTYTHCSAMNNDLLTFYFVNFAAYKIWLYQNLTWYHFLRCAFNLRGTSRTSCVYSFGRKKLCMHPPHLYRLSDLFIFSLSCSIASIHFSSAMPFGCRSTHTTCMQPCEGERKSRVYSN